MPEEGDEERIVRQVVESAPQLRCLEQWLEATDQRLLVQGDRHDPPIMARPSRERKSRRSQPFMKAFYDDAILDCDTRGCSMLGT